MKKATLTLTTLGTSLLFVATAQAAPNPNFSSMNAQSHFGDIHNASYTVIQDLPATNAGPKQMDIVDTAVSAGSFKTLVMALQKAGLVDVLKGEGPFTVFAPTDEAFAKIPEETLNALVQDKEALTSVLTYHVVPGKVMASDVVNYSSAQTVQGQSIQIDTSDGVKIDNASVISADIETANGVIHVIDSVILPKS